MHKDNDVRSKWILVVPLVVALAAACGSSSTAHRSSTGSRAAGSVTTGLRSPSSSTSRSGTATITIHNFAFSTKPVRAGATVTITNRDDTAHTVSADGGAFNTAPIFGGTTAHFRAPGKPGRYKFHCNIHANMHGVLTVTP